MEYILGRAGATFARWMIQTTEKLKPLEAAINQVLTQYPVLLVDETPLQVLKKKDRCPSTKSYTCTSKNPTPWDTPVKLAAVQAYRDIQHEEALGNQKRPLCSAVAGGADRSFG
jgi:hypothetical protein